MPNLHVIALILAAGLVLQEGEGAPGSRRAPRDRDQPRRENTLSPEELARKRELESAASDSLARAEDAALEAWIARRPSLARARGLAPLDLAPLELGAASRRAWRLEMARAQATLAEVEWANLGPGRLKDYLWLRDFLATADALSDLRGEERWDPGFYLREVLGVIRGVASARELTPNQRLQAVTAHARRVPALLETLRQDVRNPPRQAAEYADLLADELAALLVDEVPARLQVGQPSPELWRLYQEARDPALKALAELRTWLASASGRPLLLGPEAYASHLAAQTGAAVDLVALRVAVVRDIARLHAGLGDPREAAPEPPSPDEQGRLVSAALTAGWLAAFELGLVTGEPPTPQVRLATDPGPPTQPMSTDWMTNAAGESSPRLLILADGRAWSAEAREQRRFELVPAALRAAALRHGYPGELLWEQWSREHQRSSYRGLWSLTMRTAWGLYAADVATRVRPEELPLAREPELRREVERAQMFEAVRFYASMLIHGTGASEADVAREVERLAGCSPAVAAYETRRAWLDPFHGAGYLGYMELRRREDKLAEFVGEFEAASWMGRVVRNCPSSPPISTAADEKAVAEASVEDPARAALEALREGADEPAGGKAVEEGAAERAGEGAPDEPDDDGDNRSN